MTHLTISSHPVGQTNNSSLDMYNATTNISTIIYQANLNLYFHDEVLGANTLQNNSYFISTLNGTIKKSEIKTNNVSTNLFPSWTPTSNF